VVISVRPLTQDPGERARLVSRPLGELAEQARAIARGDFTRPPSAVRSGGEEFVLILPETNLEGGLAVAEKLRLAIHRTPSPPRERTVGSG
jgi:GGDEF domain-containing protein